MGLDGSRASGSHTWPESNGRVRSKHRGRAKCAYWRAKRLIVELFPESERHIRARTDHGLCAVGDNTCRLRHTNRDLELVRKKDSLLLARVAAVEEWLSGAERMSYDIA